MSAVDTRRTAPEVLLGYSALAETPVTALLGLYPRPHA